MNFQKTVNGNISFILFFIISGTLSITFSAAQTLNTNWERDLQQSLSEFQNCNNTNLEGVSPCNKYLGESLKTVYNINDFYSKSLGRYMLVSEMMNFLENSSKWELLGRAYEQDVLNKAQDLANAKKAVIAIYLDENGLGTISLILPGETKPSGSWGFQVPNSVSLLTYEPEKSYVNKGLSYAFGRNIITKVLIYSRKY